MSTAAYEVTQNVMLKRHRSCAVEDKNIKRLFVHDTNAHSVFPESIFFFGTRIGLVSIILIAEIIFTYNIFEKNDFS